MQIKRTSLLTKLLIVAVAIYAIVTLVGLQGQINATRTELTEKEKELTVSEQKNDAIDEEIKELGSDRSIERIARQKLGMVYEGEIAFYNIDD